MLRPLGVLLVLLAALPRVALAQEGYGAREDRPAAPDAGHVPVLTKPPQLLQGVEPEYPAEAQAQKLTGDVTMQVDIGADGKVSDVQVLQGAGHGFDEAAVAAVKQFVFSPAEIDNVPAPVRIQYTHHFVYREPPPPEPSPEAADAGPPAPRYPVSLKGRILERGSRKPITGAAVKAQQNGVDIGEPAITEAGGHFELRLPPGDTLVEVLDASHHPFTTHETIKEGEQLEVTYYAMPKAIGLYETVVRGNREKKEVTRHTLQREELQKVPGSFGDPVRVIQNLPGLARAPLGTGFLIVRGASPQDTGTYVDGVQLPLIFHFGGGPSVINAEFLDRIDFYPGGFGARYGRAIGGIVDVYTRPPKENEWHGSAKIDLIDSGVYVAAPITEGLTISAAGRRSYIDALLAVIIPQVTTTGAVVAPSYYDYQLRVDYKPPSLTGHSFQLFFMGSDDLLKVAQNTNTTNLELNNHTGFQRLMGTWTYRARNLVVTSAPYVGLDQQSTGIGTLQIDAPGSAAGLRQQVELTLDPAFVVRFGLDLQLARREFKFRIPNIINDYRRFPGERPDPTPIEISGRADQYDYAEYVEADLTFPFGLKVIPGLRFDAFRSDNRWYPNLDPRVILRQPTKPFGLEGAVKGSVGLYSELASPQALQPIGGNPNLPVQRALQCSLGYEQKVTDAINFDVTAFYNRRFDLAEPSRAVIVEPDGKIRRVNYEAYGKGRAWGMEVFLRHEITRNFFGWLAYTLSWAQDDPQPGLGFAPAPFDQRHILTAIAQYKLGNGWEFGGRFRLVSGNPKTPVVDATFSADTNNYSPISGAANSEREPTFHQLDLRVDKTWLFDRWQLGVYLDVQNVYNHQNVNFSVADYRYRTYQIIPDLPILPTLGVKGSF